METALIDDVEQILHEAEARQCPQWTSLTSHI